MTDDDASVAAPAQEKGPVAVLLDAALARPGVFAAAAVRDARGPFALAAGATALALAARFAAEIALFGPPPSAALLAVAIAVLGAGHALHYLLLGAGSVAAVATVVVRLLHAGRCPFLGALNLAHLVAAVLALAHALLAAALPVVYAARGLGWPVALYETAYAAAGLWTVALLATGLKEVAGSTWPPAVAGALVPHLLLAIASIGLAG